MDSVPNGHPLSASLSVLETLVSEAAQKLLGYSILGVLLFLSWAVIWYLWREIKEERLRCSGAQSQIIELGKDIAHSNTEVARTQEERNRITAELITTNSKLGTVIEHLGQILEMQHDRVLEFLRRIEAK
jgi:Mg2+/citrate symporter